MNWLFFVRMNAKMHYFRPENWKNVWGGGHAPSPGPTPIGGWVWGGGRGLFLQDPGHTVAVRGMLCPHSQLHMTVCHFLS